jgi:hypothetical protein
MNKISTIAIDWANKNIREDLQIAKEIDEGKWGGKVKYEINSIAFPVSFIVGRTKIWLAVMKWGIGYQIADLNNGFYLNHRGFSSSAEQSINRVLEEYNNK